jgi:hypothetical protein
MSNGTLLLRLVTLGKTQGKEVEPSLTKSQVMDAKSIAATQPAMWWLASTTWLHTFGKRPDMVVTALNLLVGETKDPEGSARGYWKLNV